MHFPTRTIWCALLCWYFLAACAPTQSQVVTVGGAAVGAAAGALTGQAAGKDTKTTLVVMGAGMVIGALIGNQMDADDRGRLVDTLEHNPDTHSSRWTNATTGNEYKVTPQRTFVNSTSEEYCRDVEIYYLEGNEIKKTITTACRNRGSWQLQD